MYATLTLNYWFIGSLCMKKGGLLLINLYVGRPQKVSHYWVSFAILPRRLDYCVKLTCQSRTAFCSLDVKHSMRDLTCDNCCALDVSVASGTTTLTIVSKFSYFCEC